MNVELRPRTTPFSALAATRANDNAERRSEVGEVGQSRRRAVIYKPAKSAMTSGRGGTKRWLLEFEPQSPPFIEPLMGWTGSTDPMAQVRLAFPSRDAAVAYAERQGLVYEVRELPRTLVKERVGAAKPKIQQMPLWPIELLNSAGNGFLMPEVAANDFAPNFAAA
jgi:ETC complex I subunit conserved region